MFYKNAYFFQLSVDDKAWNKCRFILRPDGNLNLEFKFDHDLDYLHSLTDKELLTMESHLTNAIRRWSRLNENRPGNNKCMILNTYLTIFISTSSTNVQVVPIKEFSSKQSCEAAEGVLVNQYIKMTHAMLVSRNGDVRSKLVTGSFSCDTISKVAE